MKLSRLATIAILASALMVSACANTIRGVGKDAANTVNATEVAGNERRERRELADQPHTDLCGVRVSGRGADVVLALHEVLGGLDRHRRSRQ